MKIKSLFAVYFMVLLAIPAGMIYCHEKILRTGEPYLFKTRPVDPYDLFRGRYVLLAYEQDTFQYKGTDLFKANDVVYLKLGRDASGFAVVESFSREKPKGKDFMRAHVAWHELSRWVYDESAKQSSAVAVNTVHFYFPFTRFYMNDRKAPLAENLYREANRTDGKNSQKILTAKVRVLNGSAVLENVLLDGKPLAEVIQ